MRGLPYPRLAVMGGYFSGRRDGGQLVEDGWKLDLAQSIRQGGLIQPGRYVAGSMKWTLTRTGEVTATIGYEAARSIPPTPGSGLYHTSTTRSTGAKTERDYRVQLETNCPNYGGVQAVVCVPAIWSTGARAVSARERRHRVCQQTGFEAGLPLAAGDRGGSGNRALYKGPEEARGDGQQHAGRFPIARGRSGCGVGRTGGSLG